MKLGIIGLGKMGLAIAHRAIDAGHEVIGFDLAPEARDKLVSLGGNAATTLDEVAEKTRMIWIMVPAGPPVESVINDLLPHLQKDDILIDGGNSNFQDTVRRARQLAEENVCFLDCGTSGGLHGEKTGFSLMIGGDKDAIKLVEPIFKAVASKDGYVHLGPSGAGHYVKMVHNGIEYALLQAYGEGFHLLKETKRYEFDLAKIANVWQHGAIIRSWINDLCYEIFSKDQNLEDISGAVGENLTGRWTYEEAQEQDVPVKLIEDAVKIREWSRNTGGNFGTKIVAMLRKKFGGHKITNKED